MDLSLSGFPLARECQVEPAPDGRAAASDRETVLKQAEPHPRRQFEFVSADGTMAAKGAGTSLRQAAKIPPAGATEVPTISQTVSMISIADADA